MAAVAPHVGNNWRSEAVCLAGCTNLECISMSAEAELQRSADENTREHKHRVLHSVQCTLQGTGGSVLPGAKTHRQWCNHVPAPHDFTQ